MLDTKISNIPVEIIDTGIIVTSLTKKATLDNSALVSELSFISSSNQTTGNKTGLIFFTTLKKLFS